MGRRAAYKVILPLSLLDLLVRFDEFKRCIVNNLFSLNPQSFGLSLSSVVLAAALTLAPGLASADNSEAQHPLAGKGTISMDIKNQTLCEVMREIKARSGVEVKLPQNLSADLISRSIHGDTWQAALGQLLEGYNYSAVWGKNGQPQQLSVYGRNQYAEGPVAANAAVNANPPVTASDDLLVYDTSAFELPQKYQGLTPGAVSPVSLPTERMKEMQLGEKVNLTLPCGQFAVVHDKAFHHANGDLTWVGYLETAGQAYRVIITMGSQGNHGQVVTPEGMYNLDVEEGHTWLVDANATPWHTESQDKRGT